MNGMGLSFKTWNLLLYRDNRTIFGCFLVSILELRIDREQCVLLFTQGAHVHPGWTCHTNTRKLWSQCLSLPSLKYHIAVLKSVMVEKDLWSRRETYRNVKLFKGVGLTTSIQRRDFLQTCSLLSDICLQYLSWWCHTFDVVCCW